MYEPQNIDKAIVRRFREVMADSIGVDKKYRFMKAFADKNEMHPQNIVSILNHRQMLSVATLKRLSQNENVSLNWLLLGVGEKYFAKPAKKKPAEKGTAKKSVPQKIAFGGTDSLLYLFRNSPFPYPNVNYERGIVIFTFTLPMGLPNY